MAGFDNTVVGTDNVGLIIEPVIESTALTSFCTVLQDVKAREKVTVLGSRSKITRLDGGCGVGAVASSLPTSEYTWLPVEYKAWEKYCIKNLRTNMIAQGIALGYEAADISKAVVMVKGGVGDQGQNTLVLDIISNMFTKAVRDDIIRKAWFGNTAITVYANPGNLTGELFPGLSVLDYNENDGFLKQIKAIVTLDSERKTAIAQNGLATYALQDALTAGQSATIFAKLDAGQTELLASKSDRVFLVSRSVAQNWKEYRMANGYSESSFASQVDGNIGWSYAGIPIVTIPDWDRWIKADMKNGTVYTEPRHFAMLTSLNNMQVAFDTTDEAMQTEFFYDQKGEEFNVRSTFAMDMKIANGDLIQVAY